MSEYWGLLGGIPHQDSLCQVHNWDEQYYKQGVYLHIIFCKRGLSDNVSKADIVKIYDILNYQQRLIYMVCLCRVLCETVKNFVAKVGEKDDEDDNPEDSISKKVTFKSIL